MLPPRGGAERLPGGGWRFTFLQRQREIANPIDWAAEGASPDDQLWVMNLHYMEYLESLDDTPFSELVLDWLSHNRPYGRNYWLDAWSSYSVSIRLVVWLQQLAVRRERLDQDLAAAMARSVAAQLDFLHAHLETDLGGNHLIKNARALLLGGCAFAGPSAKRWRQTGESLLGQELEEQILPDGTHFERSPSYHCQVFADLIECYASLADGPLRARLADVLERMATATTALTHPDGCVALFNDSGLSMAHRPAACVAAYRRATGRRVDRSGLIRLRAAGYFGVAAAENYVLVDCGAPAPDHLMAHGHGDILSFEWSLGGRQIIVDPGVYEYVAGPRRAYARSTVSHNTVTVADGEQSDFFGAFRCGRRARATVRACDTSPDGGLVLEGTHDGYARLPGRPRHVRRFAIASTADEIEIRDTVEGGGGCGVARFLLHSDCQVALAGNVARIRCGEVSVAMLAERSIVCESDASWSPDMGVWLPTSRLSVAFPASHVTKLRRCGP